MDTTDEFNLNQAISKWEKVNLSQKDLTSADKNEYKNHIQDSIEELSELGLSEEEAFIIAQMRLGVRDDWGDEIRQQNKDVFHFKKIALIFSGFILYIFFYNTIICTNRLFLIISNHLNGNIIESIQNEKTFFNIVYTISISGIVALYFLHKPIKWLIEKVNLNIIKVLFIILILAFVVILENYLVPQVAILIIDKLLLAKFYQQEVVFRYVYTVIIVVGYISIYRKYSTNYYK